MLVLELLALAHVATSAPYVLLAQSRADITTATSRVAVFAVATLPALGLLDSEVAGGIVVYLLLVMVAQALFTQMWPLAAAIPPAVINGLRSVARVLTAGFRNEEASPEDVEAFLAAIVATSWGVLGRGVVSQCLKVLEAARNHRRGSRATAFFACLLACLFERMTHTYVTFPIDPIDC